MERLFFYFLFRFAKAHIFLLFHKWNSLYFQQFNTIIDVLLVSFFFCFSYSVQSKKKKPEESRENFHILAYTRFFQCHLSEAISFWLLHFSGYTIHVFSFYLFMHHAVYYGCASPTHSVISDEITNFIYIRQQ